MASQPSEAIGLLSEVEIVGCLEEIVVGFDVFRFRDAAASDEGAEEIVVYASVGEGLVDIDRDPLLLSDRGERLPPQIIFLEEAGRHVEVFVDFLLDRNLLLFVVNGAERARHAG